MRIACCRWDDDGNMYMPRWDGAQWRWYADRAMTVQVDEPDEPRILAMEDCYMVQAHLFNDDGSSPDPRPGKQFVTRRWQIPQLDIIGDERTPEDLQRILERWLERQVDYVSAQVVNVMRKPKERAHHARVKPVVPANDQLSIKKRED